MNCRTWTGIRVCLVAGLLVSSLAGTAHADEPPTPWYKLITVNAFASTSYTWNFNDPASGTNQLRAFDFNHNSFVLDAVELVVQKAVANKGDVGFRIDVAFGSVAKASAARGLFRDPKSGQSLDIDLQQAFASYIIPIGRGLRVDFGKFVTPAGAELIDGYDGYNDNFSRGLLFTWAIPLTHTGFRLSYSFHDKFSATVMLINGWDNVLDNNAAKSFGVSLAYLPLETLSIYLNYIGGPERDGNNSDFRHTLDLVASWKPHWRFALTLNADYGIDMNAISTMTTGPVPTTLTSNAQWAGFALYARVAVLKRLAFIARFEGFWDLDGFRTAVAQRLFSFTLTPEFKVTDSMVLRADVRYDQSDQFVFEKTDGSHRKYQPTLGINALYVF